MPIITSHRYTLSGENGVELQPLCDEHLPLLYRWNSDTEVLYWSEEDDVVEPYDHEMVEQIFGSVYQKISQAAFPNKLSANSFLIETSDSGLPGTYDIWKEIIV